MIIELKYFGKISEITKVDLEQFEIENEITVENLRRRLVQKYGLLADEEFKIAVDQELVENDFVIKRDSEIALLPPFAGG